MYASNDTTNYSILGNPRRSNYNIPCKLEYNTATNGFSLIGYHAADETFHYYPLDTLPTVTVGEEPVGIDTNTLYKNIKKQNAKR